MGIETELVRTGLNKKSLTPCIKRKSENNLLFKGPPLKRQKPILENLKYPPPVDHATLEYGETEIVLAIDRQRRFQLAQTALSSAILFSIFDSNSQHPSLRSAKALKYLLAKVLYETPCENGKLCCCNRSNLKFQPGPVLLPPNTLRPHTLDEIEGLKCFIQTIISLSDAWDDKGITLPKLCLPCILIQRNQLLSIDFPTCQDIEESLLSIPWSHHITLRGLSKIYFGDPITLQWIDPCTNEAFKFSGTMYNVKLFLESCSIDKDGYVHLKI